MDENSLLRSKCAELEETYANLRARCFAMESMSKQPLSSSFCTSGYIRSSTPLSHHHQPQQRRASTAGSTRTSAMNRRVAKENQDLITSLYRRNEQIMRDYSILRNKHQNVLSNNGKLKKEVQSLRLRASANYRPRTSIFPTSSSFARTGASMRLAKDASNHCAKSAKRQDTSSFPYDVDGANETDSLSEALASTNNNQCIDAERQHRPSDPPIFATKDPTGVAFPAISYHSSDHHFQSQESLVKELADATSRLHSLKEKHGKLESTCNECLDTLEQTKRDLKVTRRAKELLEEEVSELRSQNASLEEKITQLCCDAPITSIRLPSPAATTATMAASSTAAPCPTSAAIPTNNINEDGVEDASGPKNGGESIDEKAESAAEEEEEEEEEETKDGGDQKAAKVEASSHSAVATETTSPTRAEDVATDTNTSAARKTDPAPSSTREAENTDAESQSSYQDEAFDEYADDTFED